MDPQRIETALIRWRESLSRQWDKGSAWLRHARTKDIDFAEFKTSLKQAFEGVQQYYHRDNGLSIDNFRPWLRQHGRKLSLTLLLPIAAVVLIVLIRQQTTNLNQALALRPAQLSALESLIQDSKGNTSVDTTSTLTDTEIETLRVILQNRSITPNILRLNLDQGGTVEFQTDQAAFGQWVAFLEEAARRWHLYPTQLTIKATDSTEIVSIRAVLQQSTGMAP